jgi:putative mRNA 3-end processing factor
VAFSLSPDDADDPPALPGTVTTACHSHGLAIGPGADGPSVPAGRLWLDGKARRGIGFLQAWDGRRQGSGRLLCSSRVADLLQARGGSPLAVPFGRPFQMGRLALELLPAGSSPGSAMLRMHMDGRVVLFAAAARPDALPTAEPLEWREADAIVVDASRAEAPHVSVASLEAWLERAVAAVQGGARLALQCPDAAVAIAVLLSCGARVPVALSPRLAAQARRYGHAGVALPLSFTPASRKVGPVLWLHDAPLAALTVDARWLLAPDVLAPALQAAAATEGFSFSRLAGGTALDDLVAASGARTVLAYGAGAMALCQRLSANGSTCIILAAQAQLRLM